MFVVVSCTPMLSLFPIVDRSLCYLLPILPKISHFNPKPRSPVQIIPALYYTCFCSSIRITALLRQLYMYVLRRNCHRCSRPSFEPIKLQRVRRMNQWTCEKLTTLRYTKKRFFCEWRTAASIHPADRGVFCDSYMNSFEHLTDIIRFPANTFFTRKLWSMLR